MNYWIADNYASTHATFVMLLMICHLHHESAVILLSAPNIYVCEVQMKVNKTKLLHLYVALFFFNKKVNFVIMKNFSEINYLVSPVTFVNESHKEMTLWNV